MFSAAVFMFAALAATAVDLPLDAQWTIKTQGDWRARVDHRDLLAMRHSWVESKKGNFASASREVTVPADWSGPVYLHFYCSDDYHTDKWRPDGSWLSAEGFIGHRVKQVIVDDRVLWSADVADEVRKGVSPRYAVELPVTQGATFILTLLAFDQADSAVVLDRDFYQYPNNEKTRDADPDHARFETSVYWGDVSLSSKPQPAEEGARPSAKAVVDAHIKRWPIAPPSGKVEEPVMLEVSAPAGIPAQGFPVRFGAPMPPGRIDDADKLALKTGDGKNVARQKEVLATWMDDSPQWVLLDFPLQQGVERFELRFDQKITKPHEPAPVDIKDGRAKVTLDKTAFTAAQGAQFLADIAVNGETAIAAMESTITGGGATVAGTVELIEQETAGPFRTTLLLKGRFESLGTWTVEVSAYRGLPYLMLWHRLINDSGKDLPVSSLKLTFVLPPAHDGDARPRAFIVPSGPAPAPVALKQESEKSRTLNGEAVDAAAPAFVAWKQGTIAARYFRELFPKLISGDKDRIELDLVAAESEPVVFTAGEAKSHEIWIAGAGVEPAAFAAAVANPPILQNAEYFCATGAIGLAATHAGINVLHEHMANDFGKKQWEDFGQQFGVRHFPDGAYHGGLPKWCNNYYERMLGLWSEWWMSGDRAWFDRAVEVCRHIMDVSVIHGEIPGKPWTGAMHGPGENHVAGPWNPNLRVAGLDLYYKLTGDADARQAVLDVADYVVRTKAGIDGASVRDQAGPFDTVCTAYALTGNIDLLDVGTEYVRSALRSMDMRRGVWPDEHGSKVYRGNVPWMVAQEARPLYLWYRMTGDTDAAQALVGLAESMICENTDWDRPGEMSGYSHNPHYDVTPVYDLMILPVIYAAYELTEDRFFLDAANAQWARWQREKKFDSPLNCHWNTPWLVWYLKGGR